MSLLYAKALHIIFVVTWFAGLFYIVRLFIYHREAMDKEDPEKAILIKQYKIMERRLWYYITWPSMILTGIFGLWVAWPYLKILSDSHWLLVKLGLVFLLVLYHLQCGRYFHLFQNGHTPSTSFRLRLWNEVATLLLVSIIFTVVLRSAMNWLWALAGLIITGFLLWIAVRLYRSARAQKSKSDESDADKNNS